MEINNEKDLSMKDKVDMLFKKEEEKKRKKIRKRDLRIPRKAKVKRNKIKRGWIGIFKIDENGNVSGEKQQIQGGVYRSSDGTYHATNSKEILFWQGKFPFLIQPTWKKNPIDIKEIYGDNETYGQNQIMAKMIGDALPYKKKKLGNVSGLLWIIGIAVAGYLLYSIFSKGGI